jgi:hypothetical protein
MTEVNWTVLGAVVGTSLVVIIFFSLAFWKNVVVFGESEKDEEEYDDALAKVSPPFDQKKI